MSPSSQGGPRVTPPTIIRVDPEAVGRTIGTGASADWGTPAPFELSPASFLPIYSWVKRHVAALFLGLACAAPAQAGPSLWEKVDLPPHVRPVIHERANAVPPFAHEDSTLADPKAWPKEIELGGKRCVLQITSNNSGVGSNHKTLATLWPGDTLNLKYQCRRAGKDLVFGPSYFWDSNGRLWARGWTEPDSAALRYSLYTTYDAGTLLGYHVSSRRLQPASTDTLLTLSEYFDRKGKLAGFSHQMSVGKANESQWWWGGKQVSEDEWRAARVELYRAARKTRI